MIHIEVRLLPDDNPDPLAHRKIGHVAIYHPARDLDPNSWLATIFDEDLVVNETHHFMPTELTDLSWTDLIETALRLKTRSDSDTLTEHEERARKVVRAALNTRCVFGAPLIELERLTGRWFGVAQRELGDRATAQCDGKLCGGWAHGTVLYHGDYEEILAKVLAQQIRAERRQRSRLPWRRNKGAFTIEL